VPTERIHAISLFNTSPGRRSGCFIIHPAVRFPLPGSSVARQFPAVRIPIPIVILLAITVAGGVWWQGTRQHDFLNAPPVSPSEKIHKQAVGHVPKLESVAAPPAPSTAAAKTIAPPMLALYREGPSVNAKDLLELSGTLETQGEIQRALLAAERVMDSAQPDEDQQKIAIAAIRRLRTQVPPWNDQAATAYPITLHAGAGQSTALLVKPILSEIAGEIERASSGILKVTTHVAPGRDVPQDIGPPIITAWFSGAATHTTEALTFTALSPETLREDLAASLLQLLRGHIENNCFLRIPESGLDNTQALARFHTHVTRLVWLELGSRLNPPDS
jgi:hypothetical protein